MRGYQRVVQSWTPEGNSCSSHQKQELAFWCKQNSKCVMNFTDLFPLLKVGLYDDYFVFFIIDLIGLKKKINSLCLMEAVLGFRKVELKVEFLCSVPSYCYLVSRLGPALCDPVDCSTPGFLVLHYLPEFAQTHVRWVSDAIQESHLLPFLSPLDLNLSQHQGLFQWVSSSHQVARVLKLLHQSFQWIFRVGFI